MESAWESCSKSDIRAGVRIMNEPIDKVSGAAPDRNKSWWYEYIFVRIYGNVKRRIVAGLLTLMPLGATFLVLRYVLDWMDSLAAPLVERTFEVYIPGLGILLTLALVYLVGFVAASVVGRRVIDWGEGMLMRLPIVKIVYNPVKKLLGTFALPHESRTWKTVLVEYPRRGAWMIAFVAGEIPGATGEPDMVSVFIPNTPNPAAGRVIIVARHEVRYIDVPVDDAIEFVVSGGTAIAPSIALPPLTTQNAPEMSGTEAPMASGTVRPVPPT